MSRKLALSLLLLMLGLASWDAILDHEDYTRGGAIVTDDEDGQARVMDDGTPRPKD